MAADGDLQAWLGDLPKKVRRRLVEAARGEAEALSDAQLSRLRALEQSPADSGALETSCRVEQVGDDIAVVAGGDATTVDGYDHALGFEFGTAKQPARSFFFSTYRARRAQIVENMNKAIAEAVEKS